MLSLKWFAGLLVGWWLCRKTMTMRSEMMTAIVARDGRKGVESGAGTCKTRARFSLKDEEGKTHGWVDG